MRSLFTNTLCIPTFFLFMANAVLCLSREVGDKGVGLSGVSGMRTLMVKLNRTYTVLPNLSHSKAAVTTNLMVNLSGRFTTGFDFVLSVPTVFKTFIFGLGSVNSTVSIGFLPVFVNFVMSVVTKCLTVG